MKNNLEKLKTEIGEQITSGQGHGVAGMHKANMVIMFLQRAEAVPAEDLVLAGMKNIIREAQQSGSLPAMALADDMMEFIEDVEGGRRRVAQIAYAMR